MGMLADWTMMAGGLVWGPSTRVRGCRDSRSLVEALVSSMTPSVRAMMYDVTSYKNREMKGGEIDLIHADVRR